MLLSKSSEYAIQLILYLVRYPKATFTPIKEIAAHTGISFFQLAKVAQHLIKGGILTSYTGPNGGVALSRAPHQLRLFDIVSAMEGPAVLDGCVLGLDLCRDENPCPVHQYWKEAREVITKMFKERTLDEFVTFTLGEVLAP
ncbi:MAG: RrF2 family transcriptional regulator [Fidelibacterota bacterium]